MDREGGTWSWGSLIGSRARTIVALLTACEAAPQPAPPPPPAPSGDIAPQPEAPRPAHEPTAPASTRRTIGCGPSRCTAGVEQCVRDEVRGWACIPADAAAEGDSWRCDDSSDCPAGTACCESFASAATGFVCTPLDGPASFCRREACGAPDVRSERVPLGSADAPPCASGRVCVDGACRAKTPPRPTCDRGARCGGASPMCRWRDGRGACVSEAEGRAIHDAMDLHGPGAYECTKPGDCSSGEVCCTGGAMGALAGICAHACDLANQGVVCQSDADCPVVGEPPGPLARWKCGIPPIHAPRQVPPWLRTCTRR